MEFISESSMEFIVKQKNLFHIEKSKIYKKIQEGIKIPEFLFINESKNIPAINIIEAKSSSPDPHNSQEKFDTFINDISEKFNNAVSLYFALYAGRHPQSDNDLPIKFRKKEIATGNIHFILIIKGHPKNWLSPIQEKLNINLLKTKKLWSLPARFVFVLNDEIAKKKGFIK